MSAVAAIILAAGRGRRFAAGSESSKVLAELDGKSLIRHVAEAAIASQARPIVVVTGQAGAKVKGALAGLDVTCVRNEDPDAGLSRSLQTGLAALPDTVAGTLILLADMPYVSTAVIDRLIAAFDAAQSPHAVVPICRGQRGNPVLLGRRIFAAARAIEGDRGARVLLERPGLDVIDCPVDDEAIALDIDTREALEQARSTRAGRH